jgi:dUTP pyrophosphatase
MQIEIINRSKHPLPKYETDLSAGMDLYANIEEPMVLKPMQRALIKTGISIALPYNYEAQIRPRSGLAYKNGITVLNSPGTIDADYRGEVGVLLVNLSDVEYCIEDGTRIAQMIIAPYTKARWNSVEELSDTNRGAGGFGSTGKK